MSISTPTKLPLPFNNSGVNRNAIPTASQIGITPGAASLTDGFPPLTMTPSASGGVPPFGQDFNGILYLITQALQYGQSGGQFVYDGTWATAVGGYPLGALVQSSDQLGLWLNISANNTTNPDTGGAGWVLLVRKRLNANTTFYVSTTGSDSTGNGTSGAPWLTLQNAYTQLQKNWDLNGYQATILMAAGTYASLVANEGCVGQNSPVIISGQSGSPTAVTVTSSSNNAIGTLGNAYLQVQYLVLSTTGSNNACLSPTYASIITLGAGVTFGSCGGSHMFAAKDGNIILTSNYSVTSGAAYYHMQVDGGGNIETNGGSISVSYSGSPAFTAFAGGFNCGTIELSMAGGYNPNGTGYASVTGAHYSVNTNGVVNTNGSGATYFPGNSAGIVGSYGGVYVP